MDRDNSYFGSSLGWIIRFEKGFLVKLPTFTENSKQQRWGELKFLKGYVEIKQTDGVHRLYGEMFVATLSLKLWWWEEESVHARTHGDDERCVGY